MLSYVLWLTSYCWPYALSMCTICIRPVKPTDLQALKPMLDDMGFIDDHDLLADRFPLFCSDQQCGFLLAEQNNQILGYALAQDFGIDLRSGNDHRTAKLHDLYVLPEFRRRGVASQLIDAIKIWAKERPLRYVFWYANQREASPIYQKMGYQPEGSGQEGYDYFEIDFGNPKSRTPHPTRGS